MGFIEKLKLLFKIRKPASDLIDQVKEAKSGWKTWQFWITTLGLLSAVVTAASGLIPMSYVIAITTAIALITALYNVWRGAEKAQQPGQKPFFQTSEFWVSILACLATALMRLKSGGIDPKWSETAMSAITVILGSLGAGQNLAGQQPSAPSLAPAGPAPTQLPGVVPPLQEKLMD